MSHDVPPDDPVAFRELMSATNAVVRALPRPHHGLDFEAEARELATQETKAHDDLMRAVADLSRTVAPLLAVFRDGLEGTVSDDQVDAAVAAMGEVQRCEAAHALLYFDRKGALLAAFSRGILSATDSDK